MKIIATENIINRYKKHKKNYLKFYIIKFYL